MGKGGSAPHTRELNKNDQFLAVEGRLLIHRGFTGHACRPHEKSGLESYTSEFLRRFSNDIVLMKEYREYITARRDFMLLMFKYVCLRPSELRDLPLQDNMLSLLSPEPALILPTYKRRKMRGCLRRYPVSKKAGSKGVVVF